MKDKILLVLRIGLFYGGLLLGPVWNQEIGTEYIIKVIVFLAILMIYSVASSTYIEKNAPKSYEARKIRVKDNRRIGVDRILLPLYMITVGIAIVSIPLDMFIWTTFSKLNLIFNVLGALIFIFSLIISFLSVYNNPFITVTIHDQSDREQKVVSTGVYGVVRHPFYTSIILQLFGMSLWFGSILSILVVLVALIILAIRILFEENDLKKRLPEYKTYVEKTKFRLIPYIW